MRSLFALIFCLFLALPAVAADQDEAAEQAAALEFVKKVQKMVADDQRDELAKLVTYPLDVDYKPKAKTAAALVKAYDTIFTKAVRECVQKHNLKEEVNNIKGAYMIGWGCIWFEPDDDGKMHIVGINTKE